MTMITSRNYINTLKKILSNNDLSFLHSEINNVLAFYNDPFNNKLYNKPTPVINDIVFYKDNEKLFLPINEEDNTVKQMLEKVYGYNKNIPSNGMLEKIINLIADEILKSSNSKYINIYKAILSYPEAKYLLTFIDTSDPFSGLKQIK